VKNLTWQNPGQLFVAQELIKIVKLKCCGIKGIIVPESKYIERFEKVANPLDGQIRCKEEESRRLASLRDTLLPKLMSGELILDEANV